MPTATHDIIMEFAREVKRILGSSLKQVILYGSYARGDYNVNSDIDIMVLTTLTDAEIEQVKSDVYGLAFDFQMGYGVDISVVLRTRASSIIGWERCRSMIMYCVMEL